MIVGIKFLFIYLLINNKIKSYNFLIVGPVALLIISPHLYWLFENNFVTLFYGLERAESNSKDVINHILNPIVFILKQFTILIPFLLMTFFLIKRISFKQIKFDKN